MMEILGRPEFYILPVACVCRAIAALKKGHRDWNHDRAAYTEVIFRQQRLTTLQPLQKI